MPAETELRCSAKGLQESAAALRNATSGRCIATAADVRNPEAVKQAVDATIREYGKIDFVICGTSMDL